MKQFSSNAGPVVIFGVGGMGRTVYEWVLDCIDDSARLVGFLDDDGAQHGQRTRGLPVLGGADWVQAHPGTNVVVGVGSPMIRLRIVRDLSKYDVQFPTLVHPSAVVGRSIKLGAGTIVGPGCILTTDAEVGEHVLFNSVSKIGHDSFVGTFSTMAPGAMLSGNDTVGEGVEIGTGAIVLQELTIGEWSMVCAGSLVNRDIPANVTVAGMPARAIKSKEPGWQL